MSTDPTNKKFMDMEKTLKQFITQGLRRLSYRWKPRYTALKKAHKARNQYECSECKQLFTRKEIQVDHRIPVVDPVKGFTTWDDFIVRMFCDEDNYNVLCIEHHKIKTLGENNIRKEMKVKKEKPKKITKKKATKKASKK